MENFKKYFVEKAGLEPEIFEKTAEKLNAKKVQKGGFLLKQGEHCKHTFFVEKGVLRMYSLNSQGKECILQFASENWLMSDRGSVHFNEASSYYIEVIEDAEVYLLDEKFILDLSEKSASFRVFNERALQNHVRHLHRRIDSLLGATAEERYLDFITLYPDLMLRVPQWMIASYLGVTPESLSRVRKALSDKNFKK